MTDPAAWYDAAARLGVPALLQAALVASLAAADAQVPDAAVTAALDDPRTRNAVLAAVLRRSTVDDVTELVIGRLTTGDAPFLTRALLRDSVDDILHRLLAHQIPSVAGAAALTFAVGRTLGPALPAEWRSAWTDAVLGIKADELGRRSWSRLAEVLEHLAAHDPDIFEQWFIRRTDEMAAKGFVTAPRPYGCEKQLAELPPTNRERLARRHAGQARVGHSLLRNLLGHDRDLAQRLLDEGTVTTTDLLDVVEDQRGDVLEQIGSLLLDRGVQPDLIARTAARRHQWIGPESSAHQRLIDYFEELGVRVPALKSVADAGRLAETAARDDALAREHQDRVRGR